jgi:FixJ family two-component response regulator
MPMVRTVYIVDDDEDLCRWLMQLLHKRGLECRAFADGQAFLDALDGLAQGCLLLDTAIPRQGGPQVQAELVARGSDMAVVAMVGLGNIDSAVQAMKLGALDLIEKPFTEKQLIEVLHGIGVEVGDRAPRRSTA